MRKKFILLFSLLTFIMFVDMNSVFASNRVSPAEIEPRTYVIGNYVFQREPDENAPYKGVLTVDYIMLAAKSLNSNDINDMIIYYKNPRGEWLNAVKDEEIEVPEYFDIDYIDLVSCVIPEYQVTFNSNGGSDVASQTIEEGQKAVVPTNPTKAHYNFGEWQLNGTTYDFDSAVTGNIELTATWTQKTFTIRKTPVDNLSLDVRLTVYEEGEQVEFENIMYNNNVVPTTVNGSSIQNITEFQVTLTDGIVVNATVQ